jgi:AraC family transcriptional regulator
MPPTYIATFDPVSHRPLPVIDDSCVVWSSGGRVWDGLIIEQHRFNSQDTPEFEIPDYSLIIQLSPALTIEEKINGRYQSRVSRPGNICLFSAGAPRQFRTAEPFEVLVITLSADALNRVACVSHNQLNPELEEHHQLCDAQIEHIGMALKAEVETGCLSGRLYGESMCLALAAHLLSQYAVVKSVCEQKGGMAPQSLRRVVEYIHENLTEDLPLSKLAAVAGLSQYRFSHNFKLATGIAPHQFIIRERMELAKRMLRETNMSVIAIAYAVGCGNPSRFTLLFHRTTGITPSVYRASFK